MSGGADTVLATRVLLQLVVIRSVPAELASAAIRLQDATSGGAHGAYQV
jgi:hypothetical protein